MFGSSLPPVVGRKAHVLFTLLVFACVQWCPTHIPLCFCLDCLRFVYSMLPVSLYCSFFIVLRYYLTFIYKLTIGKVKWNFQKIPQQFFEKRVSIFCLVAKHSLKVTTRNVKAKFLEEEYDDTKWVIRIRKSKKDSQQNGQMKKDKRTNNDLQNITHKTKDRVTRTPLQTGATSCAPEGQAGTMQKTEPRSS